MISLRLRGKGPARRGSRAPDADARPCPDARRCQPASANGRRREVSRTEAPCPARPPRLRGEVASPPAAAGDFFTGPGLETRAGSERALLPASFKPSAAAINSHATATAHGAAAAALPGPCAASAIARDLECSTDQSSMPCLWLAVCVGETWELPPSPTSQQGSTSASSRPA